MKRNNSSNRALQRLFFVAISAVMLSLLCTALFAQPGAITFDVLETFDYPGGNSTSPRGVNGGGDVSGYFYDSAGAAHGFIRFRNGSFSPPINEPNGSDTFALGINSSRIVVGDFFSAADSTSHGFLFSHRTYTQFDVGGLVSTNILGINDANDLVGDFYDDTQTQGFVDIGGNTTVINIPGALATVAEGINSLLPKGSIPWVRS
jgi:hypothetical protein